MDQCVGIRKNGTRCGNVTIHEGRCGTHMNTIRNHGPHTTARDELKYKQKKELNDIKLAYAARPALEGDDALLAQRNHLNEISIMKIRHRREKDDLATSQLEEIQRTGVNPDQVAIERRVARRIQLDEWNTRRREEFLRHRQERAEEAVRQANQVIAAEPDPLAQRQLRDIAADPQNVHTTEAVRQTKEIVAKIRVVPVPEGYRWHPIECSKTPFEIGLECKLSQKAAWQMIAQYALSTAIYDIEAGIYGKVLDCVWQFIKTSPDKDDLCKIVKREMEDNIGMCAQGNLSRICNILAGYMEGVGSQESIAERLGRLLPPLMEIENDLDRRNAAMRILDENNVPQEQRAIWIEPLLNI
jgi:hypothetical protein